MDIAGGKSNGQPRAYNAAFPNESSTALQNDFAGDVIIKTPFYLGLGLRKNYVGDNSVTLTGVSLLVNHRFGSQWFIGPVLTANVPSSIFESGSAMNHQDKYTSHSVFNYSGGIEIGRRLSNFIVGFEGGWETISGSDFIDSNNVVMKNTDGGTLKFNLNGAYVRAKIGIWFDIVPSSSRRSSSEE